MLTVRILAGVALAGLVASGTWTAPALAQHQHHHGAPHGGTLIELGHEAAHLEVVIDRRSGGIVVYVLDGEAERAVRVAQTDLELRVHRADGTPSVTLTLRAAANVLTGEAVGDSSQFGGTHDALRSTGVIRGTIGPVTVRGATYRPLSFVVPAVAAKS